MSDIEAIGNAVTELTKLGNKLLDKFSDITGYFMAERIAIREGKANAIREFSERKDIDPEIKYFITPQIKKAKNIGDILALTIPHIKEDNKIEELDEDWISLYCSKAENISSDEMKKLWARILAGECNNIGSVSKSLLHTLSIMDQNQAHLFCNISRFCFRDMDSGELQPLIFLSTNVDLYNSCSITSSGLKELANLGLIECDFHAEFVFSNYEGRVCKKKWRYPDRQLTIYGDSNNNGKIKIGNVRFTSNGQLLYELIDEGYKLFNSQIYYFILEKLYARYCEVEVESFYNKHGRSVTNKVVYERKKRNSNSTLF